MKKCYLKKGKERSVLRGHPWVFSGALKAEVERAGEWMELCDHQGTSLGLGFTEKGSIAFKSIGSAFSSPEQAIVTKLQKAHALRRDLGLLDRKDLDIYRLFFAEGDGLPALIIDCYGAHAVVQLHSRAYVEHLELITEQLAQLGYRAVYLRQRSSLRDEKMEDGYLKGKREEEVFLENGIPFHVDWEQGQKTGFFIDQRDNRQMVRKLASGKNVLNVFSYTGGFSSYALKGGARSVVSLDSSQSAVEMACRNADLLDLAGQHTGLTKDAFDYLKKMPSHFDLVVVDPPAFAKSPKSRHRAIQAYKRINKLAMMAMPASSLLLTFSCSQHLGRDLFVSTLRSAAIESGRDIRLLQHLQQGADHPSSIDHPEGEYLKGLLFHLT
jgi:23S rRNA (cytosine1962-C5)-methyltransferase